MYELKVEKIEGFADGLVSCSVWNLQWGDTQIVLAMGLLYAVSKGGRCLTAYSQGLWGKKQNKQTKTFLFESKSGDLFKIKPKNKTHKPVTRGFLVSLQALARCARVTQNLLGHLSSAVGCCF